MNNNYTIDFVTKESQINMKYISIFIVSLVLLLINNPIKLSAQAFVDVESGAVFTGYCEVRIPGTTGTKFSLTDDLKANPTAFIRVRAGYTIKSRHTIFALYAPLTVKSEGIIGFDIDFNGESWSSGSSLNSSYKFNSYRITYRYDIVMRPKFEFGFGFTAKIRDADITISGEGKSSSKVNVGFVPIINFRLNWKPGEKFGVVLEGDALGASRGRAEDIMLAVTFKPSDHFVLGIYFYFV